MRIGFSETLLESLRQAETEALALQQDFVGAEHLLLGILSGNRGDAMKMLKAACSVEQLRQLLVRALPQGKDPVNVTGRLPTTPKAQRVINAAMAESQAAGSARVSTRHVLAAILKEDSGAVREALRSSGADVDELQLALSRETNEIES